MAGFLDTYTFVDSSPSGRWSVTPKTRWGMHRPELAAAALVQPDQTVACDLIAVYIAKPRWYGRGGPLLSVDPRNGTQTETVFGGCSEDW